MLEAHPELCGCAVVCVDCEIRFLTHPRNAGRINLRCPFGCRRHHRRQRCNERSAAYYGTPAGKLKKERLNARRCRGSPGKPEVRQDPAPRDHAFPPRGESDGQASLEPTTGLQLEGWLLDESSVDHSPVLPYVRMLVSLIEGVAISLIQVGDWLRQALRQHSFAQRRRRDYVLAFLHRHPP